MKSDLACWPLRALSLLGSEVTPDAGSHVAAAPSSLAPARSKLRNWCNTGGIEVVMRVFPDATGD